MLAKGTVKVSIVAFFPVSVSISMSILTTSVSAVLIPLLGKRDPAWFSLLPAMLFVIVAVTPLSMLLLLPLLVIQQLSIMGDDGGDNHDDFDGSCL